MGVFISIDFSDEVVKEIARVDGIVGNKMFTGKFSELENLHLTLKFLGEINDKKLEEVREKLKEIKFRSFDGKLGKIGIFHAGKMRKPRIVWIKINGAGVFELQKEIDNALEGLFSKEERFMSHLTIARVKYVGDKKEFEKYVKNIKVKGIKFNVDCFKLKSSELMDRGPIYKDIEIVKLKDQNIFCI